MPITLISKEITVDYALALCCASLPRIIMPEGLFRTIIIDLDRRNASFNNANHLAAAVGARVENYATDVQFDLDHFVEIDKPFAQFKKVVIGRVGPMNVAILDAKVGRKADLAEEARMLMTLKVAGLRTVPVYDSPETIETTGRMKQKAVKGNFLDCKEGFTKKQNLNLLAALLGIPGANREADSLTLLEKKILEQVALKQYPQGYLLYIENAIKDFKKIMEFLNTTYISDLQGFIEFGTGKFYIIDPLKLGPIENALQNEKACVEYVKSAIGLLETLKAQKRF